jgi:DNA-binding MarR family transcriptional regulator
MSDSKPVNTSYLEGLLGYNARRAALSIIDKFLERMAPFGLRPVEFSVLVLIQDNPGITSRQLCDALNLLPPNLVGLIAGLEKRDLLRRKVLSHDKRSLGLELTAHGKRFTSQAKQSVSALEGEVAGKLSQSQQKTLISLLQTVYKA